MGPDTSKAPIVIWQFVDGKPGHQNQTLGLIGALGRLHNIDVHVLPLDGISRISNALAWLCGRFTDGRHAPDPDLIVGAGAATHLPMLAAKRARGGRTIVLMKPSLPLSCFDLCLIPEHDESPARANVINTRGVLNRLHVDGQPHGKGGLILLGGPSSHYHWSDERLLEQLDALATDPQVHDWTIVTSRRTPIETIPKLSHLQGERVSIVSPDSVDSEWLPTALTRCSCAWVTEDSVSMIYEALTAGAPTGILEVPSSGSSRVQRGVQTLVDDAWVTTFSKWRESRSLAPAPDAFNEAYRTADLITQRWL